MLVISQSDVEMGDDDDIDDTLKAFGKRASVIRLFMGKRKKKQKKDIERSSGQ